MDPISTGSPRKHSPAEWLVAALTAGIIAWAGRSNAANGLFGSEPKLLPPEQAFRLAARAVDPKMVEIRFYVADGYYLYRDKLAFSVEPLTPGLGKPELPAGKVKHDQFFGDVETYRGALTVKLPLKESAPGQVFVIKTDSQGCADAGICYPPNTQQVRLTMPIAGAGPGPLMDPQPMRVSGAPK
jgi:thioredoxin:protein disulfide reductase